jgi:hypothetical protein
MRRAYACPKRLYQAIHDICKSEGGINVDDIPAYRKLNAMEEDRLPLLPLYEMTVPRKKKNLKRKRDKSHRFIQGGESVIDDDTDDDIDDDNDDATQNNATTIKVPCHDLFDLIIRGVQWPGNLEAMSFAAKYNETHANELCHGAIYRESPLFTQPCVVGGTNGMKFFLGDDVVYRKEGVEDLQLGRIVAICEIDPDGDKKFPEEIPKRSLSETLERLKTGAKRNLMCRVLHNTHTFQCSTYSPYTHTAVHFDA